MRKVILLCGGRSAEHDVSLVSVRSVIRNLDSASVALSVIGIRKDGTTFGADELRSRLELDGQTEIGFPQTDHWVKYLLEQGGGETVVFPVLHGPYGEDGTVQGVLEVLDLPYVGASVGGSAVGMNKVYCKAILKAAGLPVLPHIETRTQEWLAHRASLCRRVEETLTYPVFVKPANMGSSIGISRCTNQSELEAGIDLALEYDELVLVEQGIDAREIELSVLGGCSPEVSIPGEIVPADTFYSYNAKYHDERSGLLIPAPLADEKVAELQWLAREAYLALQLEGMARVDFLLDRSTEKAFVNEPNTIPGFTQISMYPKLWEASGLPYKKLLERLIELGIERHQRRSKLKVDL